AYLIDTDWMADYLGGKSQAMRLLASLGEERISISIITFGEIYEGVYYGPNPAVIEARFLGILRWIDVVSLDLPIMREYARLSGSLRSAGMRLDAMDLLIAATAIAHDLTLVTRNVRHFGRIPGLSLLP
ncbi:MAG TPA: type II toxin-antitoxin system VapC family toxin, partial [Thermomicrobiales bacterium]|nr:type II toxin-antitoxin system VapC family toxin [Thermomicrobiales bacterium]